MEEVESRMGVGLLGAFYVNRALYRFPGVECNSPDASALLGMESATQLLLSCFG